MIIGLLRPGLQQSLQDVSAPDRILLCPVHSQPFVNIATPLSVIGWDFIPQNMPKCFVVLWGDHGQIHFCHQRFLFVGTGLGPPGNRRPIELFLLPSKPW
jgi:hypothetical protein